MIAVWTSAPLIAYAMAPALAIAFYRTALAAGVLAPVALTRRRRELRALTRTARGRRDAAICALAGVALAAHFATWIPSVKLTTVAAATALVCTQPVWTALLAVLRGKRVAVSAWTGIALAVIGAALATGADLTVSPKAVVGDLLALLGGLLAAFYTTYGERARTSVSTTAYTAICYSTCGAVLLAVCPLTGTRLAGFGPGTWLAIGALAAGPQLLGHSLINFALRRVTATTVSVLLLLEVPGAALITWIALGQVPAAGSLPGLAMLLAGVVVVVVGAGRSHRVDVKVPVASQRSPRLRAAVPAAPQPTNGGTAISPEAMLTT